MSDVFRQAKSLPAQAELRPLYPPPLPVQAHLKGQILLQARRPKILAWVRGFTEARAPEQEGGIDR